MIEIEKLLGVLDGGYPFKYTDTSRPVISTEEFFKLFTSQYDKYFSDPNYVYSVNTDSNFIIVLKKLSNDYGVQYSKMINLGKKFELGYASAFFVECIFSKHDGKQINSTIFGNSSRKIFDAHVGNVVSRNYAEIMYFTNWKCAYWFDFRSPLNLTHVFDYSFTDRFWYEYINDVEKETETFYTYNSEGKLISCAIKEKNMQHAYISRNMACHDDNGEMYLHSQVEKLDKEDLYGSVFSYKKHCGEFKFITCGLDKDLKPNGPCLMYNLMDSHLNERVSDHNLLEYSNIADLIEDGIYGLLPIHERTFKNGLSIGNYTERECNGNVIERGQFVILTKCDANDCDENKQDSKISAVHGNVHKYEYSNDGTHDHYVETYSFGVLINTTKNKRNKENKFDEFIKKTKYVVEEAFNDEQRPSTVVSITAITLGLLFAIGIIHDANINSKCKFGGCKEHGYKWL